MLVKPVLIINSMITYMPGNNYFKERIPAYEYDAAFPSRRSCPNVKER